MTPARSRSLASNNINANGKWLGLFFQWSGNLGQWTIVTIEHFLCHSYIYIWLQAHRCAWEVNKRTIIDEENLTSLFEEDNLSSSHGWKLYSVNNMQSNHWSAYVQTTIFFVTLKAKNLQDPQFKLHFSVNDNNDSSHMHCWLASQKAFENNLRIPCLQIVTPN